MSVRVSQTPVEALVQPDNAKVRTTQAAVEALVRPDSAFIRASQFAVEAIVKLPVYHSAAQATATASGTVFINSQKIAIGKTIGTANSKTSSNTLTLTTTTNVEVGDMLVIMTAWDNNNAGTVTGPDADSFDVVDSVSNTYTPIAGAEDASANARSACGVYASFVTNIIPAGSNITITYVSARTAKAALGQVIKFRTNTVKGFRIATLKHAHDRAADPSPLYLNFDALNGYEKIILHGLSAEGPNTDAYTWDSNYEYLPGDGTTGSTDDTNMHIRGGIRIGATSLVNETINVTSNTADRDYTQLAAVLYPIPVDEATLSQYSRIYDNTAFLYRGYAGKNAISDESVNSTSGTLSIYAATSGVPKNTLAVVYVACDNNNTSTTSGPDDSQLVASDISGNTWISQAAAQRAASGGTSTHVGIFTSLITNEIPIGGWIRVTHTVSRRRNFALSIHLFSVESTLTRADRTYVHNAASDPSSMTLSNLPFRRYLMLHALAAEAPPTDAYTWDADYIQLTPVGDGTAQATSNTVVGSYRIAELTSDTIDIISDTRDADYSQVFVALYTDPIPRINITLGG